MIAALLLAAAVPDDSAATPSLRDPYQIFARARAYWLQRHYPPLVEYNVAVSVLEGGTLRTERYWSAYDSVNQEVTVDSVSDYERAHPTYPAHGLNLVVRGPSLNIPFLSHLLKPQPPIDFLGVPLLAPNYTFGMARIPPTSLSTPDPMQLVRDVRAAYADPDPRGAREPTPMPGTLPIIEQETVYNRAYRVTLEGVEPTYGVPAYHLQLQALRDPGRYRLEALWVDTHTLAPIQLVERLNFVDGPATLVPWRIRFTKIGDGLYVYDERALEAMRYDGLLYPAASVSFENIHAVEELSRPPPLFGPQTALVMSEPTLP